MNFFPDALVKFVDSSVASTILSNHNHTINGTHVVMRIYQPETNINTNQPKIPSLMSQNINQAAHEQLLKENQLLKQDINILKKSLDESQAYSQTAYDTVQALRKQLGRISKSFFLFPFLIVIFKILNVHQR